MRSRSARNLTETSSNESVQACIRESSRHSERVEVSRACRSERVHASRACHSDRESKIQMALRHTVYSSTQPSYRTQTHSHGKEFKHEARHSIQARRQGTVFKHTSIVQDSSSPHTIFEHRQTTIEHHRTGRIQTHSQRALHYSSQQTSSAQAHIQAQSHRTVFKHAHLQAGSGAAAARG